MDGEIDRRTALQRLAAGTAGLLFRVKFSHAENWTAPQAHRSETGPPQLELTLRSVSEHILRITVAAADEPMDRIYGDGSLVERPLPSPILRMESDATPHTVPWSKHNVQVAGNPLRITVRNGGGSVIQELRFETSPPQITFLCGDAPLFGLGEGAHTLDRRGTVDAMRTGQRSDDLRTFGGHLPIPWLMSPAGWGLFFHEPWGKFDLRSDVGIFRPDESARGQDVFLLLGDTPVELLGQWAELTGHPHLPPLWALGYQQSHRTLASRDEILQEAQTFREKKLPCDALIYLGTGFCPSGWNTGHGSFTFNESVFPDPEEMIDELHRDHFKVVLHVVNPPINLHGKVSDTGTAAAEPGDAANYWAYHVPLIHMGVDGWWPDEGDPLPVAARLTRNEMYWEGDRQTRPNLRPYALHRNGYAGIQRYGWLWSGDIFSTWKTLEAQVMQGINVGLSGIPYWGTDTGGFVPTKEFTAELFLRWFQFSAFCPLFRGHGRTWKLRLPWGWDMGNYGPAELSPEETAVLPKPADLHNPEVERICRKYLETRYRLLPYIYSSVEETHRTGVPLMRALWLHFPQDTLVRTTSDAYMFGPALLVAPVLEAGAKEREVYLPTGAWWDFWTAEKIAGGKTVSRAVDLETLPVYVRAGSIVPTGPIKQFAMQPSDEPITLTVYPAADGHSTLYEDDGTTFAYERGNFVRTELYWRDAERTLVLRSGASKSGRPRKFRVAVAGASPREISFSGRSMNVHLA